MPKPGKAEPVKNDSIRFSFVEAQFKIGLLGHHQVLINGNRRPVLGETTSV